jgi:hypothetical protein
MTPTLPGFQSLAKLLSGLPIGELLDLIEGRATLDEGFDLASEAVKLFALAFPPDALAAGEAALALGALQWLLDASGAGSSPLRIAPGQNPIRGGFDGARGHL